MNRRDMFLLIGISLFTLALSPPAGRVETLTGREETKRLFSLDGGKGAGLWRAREVEIAGSQDRIS